ncbi:hypothetical protein [Lutibacter sp.]|uniref:hypothetical protein n=1 Tax=Lutibacter sp. TaxID=1925666 RepID=UPI0035622808
MFASREEVGNLIAEKSINYCKNTKTVIIAIPRGGIAVGSVISKNKPSIRNSAI